MTKKTRNIIIIGATVSLLLLATVNSSASTNDDEIMTRSFLGSKENTGIRNNNPGNIKIGRREYLGEIPKERNTDGTHEQFVSFVFGVAAQIRHIQRYIDGDMGVTKCAGVTIQAKKDTIERILRTWACSDYDNNPTENYIAFVVKRTGIGRTQIIDRDDYNQMLELSYAMALYECGVKYERNILSRANWEKFFQFAWEISKDNP